jgi:protein SCO1/2
MKNLIILFSILFIGYSGFSQADQQPIDPEIGITEKLDEYLPDDIVIINTNGEREYLSALLDKPTVIAIVYYRCPGICSPFMTSVAEVVQNSNLEI